MTTQRIGLILATAAAALATKLFVQKVAQLFRSEVIFVMVLVWNRSASFHIFSFQLKGTRSEKKK